MVERLDALWTPLIIVNLKTYKEGTGKKALELANNAEKVCRKTDVCIGLAPQYTEITRLAQKGSLPIFAQHIDPIRPGSFTGHILPEAIKKAGAIGSLINHSERRLKLADIDFAVKRAKELNLISVACTNNLSVSICVATLNPEFLAIEPPELIGTGIPVSRSKPKIVTETVKHVQKINPKVIILCGAGITKGEDVAAAIKLGTKGILVASGVVRAKKPYEVLLDFAQAAK